MKRTQEIFTEYNHLWREGKLSKPLNIMVGGNIGTGKSTFTELLTRSLQHMNVLPTGIVRSVLQSLDVQESMPELYGHSYQLGELINDSSLTDEQKAVVAFERQLSIVDKAIRRILDFSQTEGQQYILDGNHVKAQTISELQSSIHLIGVFFQTTNIEQYMRNVGGPTHQRQLTEQQFKIVRAIHDYLVSEAKKNSIPVFEYNEQEEALQFIASQVAIIIER